VVHVKISKIHQLPYPRSGSVCKAPLGYIFFGCSGPSLTFVGKLTYYFSLLMILRILLEFIYFAKNQIFFINYLTSNNMLKYVLIRKSFPRKLIVATSIRKELLFSILVFLIMSHVLMMTNTMAWLNENIEI
jgi:hypothetical protein